MLGDAVSDRTMHFKDKLKIAASALSMGAMFTAAGTVIAADHVDSPNAKGDAAGDITDVYAWAEGDSVTAIVAFAGLAESGEPATYDADVLYGLHVDNDGDGESDHDIWIRFGQNDAGEWGVQVTGLAGQDAVVGPVDEVIDAELGQRVYAGLRDDPFFFDLEGFRDTLMTGTLSFQNDRNFFAGVNVTAIVIEASRDQLANGDEPFTIWATTRR
jgi:hypothetical protein